MRTPDDQKETKCYIYTRVSTAIQVDGYSLEAQKDKLRKYAEYQDYSIAGEYSDEGFSGKNIQGRLEFQRMLQDIQDRKDDVDYVLVFKLSRFGRNAADVLNSLQLMQDFGVNLICVEDGIDSSKDAGKLMISVLSAVAEIERENIRTQTMAGREQKAREGRWNGGFAPYGYKLVDGELIIAEDEAEVIQVIYDRYIHTNEGVSNVAKYLNDHGYVKKIRQNGTIPGFSDNFVKKVIDNPVYMGKIAYRREKVRDVNHVHLLSGLLRCPDCGKPLYGNIAKAHSKDNKTRYYYYCKNTRGETGHRCSFRTNLEQTEIDRYVAAIISAMVHDKQFEEAIQKKIGTAVNTDDLEKELDAVKNQLRQMLATKTRLETQMDTMDVSDPHHERKILDLQRRYDDLYDKIAEAEQQIEEIRKQIQTIRSEQISGENVYQLLMAFDELYSEMDEPDKKDLLRAIIERIDLYPEKRADGCWIRNIVFTFPVPIQGVEVKELPLEKSTLLETVVSLSRK